MCGGERGVAKMMFWNVVFSRSIARGNLGNCNFIIPKREQVRDGLGKATLYIVFFPISSYFPFSMGDKIQYFSNFCNLLLCIIQILQLILGLSWMQTLRSAVCFYSEIFSNLTTGWYDVPLCLRSMLSFRHLLLLENWGKSYRFDSLFRILCMCTWGERKWLWLKLLSFHQKCPISWWKQLQWYRKE